MTDKSDILKQLAAMSRGLAQPEKDYVIIAEGNTSAIIEKDTFWIKASGTRLHQIDTDGFVQVSVKGILSLLDKDNLTDDEVKRGLAAATIDHVEGVRPSLETMLHAVAYELTPARFVGHTHPTAVNAITCSKVAEQTVKGRLFHDHVTVCGRAPAYVPYADPGIPLARHFRESVIDYLKEYEEPPRVIFLQNHGLVVLGGTPTEVENITAMVVKAARILQGTFAFGGPRFLSQEDIDRVHTRPDELYRLQAMRRLEEKATD